MPKAYTMREMKAIVDYLKEHRAYGEIRGRKMWVDFANAKNIGRTWQSLKETFLKRILPDIHNPYYKLTVEEISSFRQGRDVSNKGNKLEIQTISDSSSVESIKLKNQPSTSKDQQENDTGEDIICAKIQEHARSSTDTLVLENCYENAEDIQRDLESSPITDKTDKTSVKSLRDCIMYSEPLTPMLQEVLHDFDTSDDEPQMQIVEECPSEANGVEETNGIEEANGLDSPKQPSPDSRRSKSFDDTSPSKVVQNTTEEEPKEIEQFPKPIEPSKIKSLKLKKTQTGTWETKEAIANNGLLADKNNTETNNNILAGTENSEHDSTAKDNSYSKDKPTQQSNTSSNATDTQLPNNQEGLFNNTNGKRTSTESVTSGTEKKKEKSRKRSHSQSTEHKKKSKKKKHRTASEMQEHANDTEDTISSERTSNDGQNDGNNENGENTKDQNNSKEDPSKNNQTSEPSKENNGPSPSEINPCLKSVSLYEEQFSQSKYSSDSENEDNSKVENVVVTVHNIPEGKKIKKSPTKAVSPNNDKRTDKNRTNAEDVVLLKSHSESEGQQSLLSKSSESIDAKKSRAHTLANLFGFSSGRASTSRLSLSRNRGFRDKSKLSRYAQRRPTGTRNNHHRGTRSSVELVSSDDYTSESGSDEPPAPAHRERTDRHLDRFKKPEPLNILGSEMGFFAAGRKRIYPVVLKEGKWLHFTASAQSDDDEEESYWKSKYLDETKKLAEEKIRADELSRLLEQTKQMLELRRREDKRSISPILQANRLSNNGLENAAELSSSNAKNAVIPHERVSTVTEPKKTVKIKFTKDREIEVEGSWSQVEPAVDKMVQIFGNGAEPKPTAAEQKAETKEGSSDKSDKVVRISSDRSSTPASRIDPEVREKVNKIESEIFKKIEEMDKEEDKEPSMEEENKATDENVTKRKRGRPRKVPSISGSIASLDTVSKPSTSTKKSTEVEVAPTTSNKKSTVNEVAPRISNKKSTEVEVAPTTSNKKSTVYEVAPKTSNRKSTEGEVAPTTSNKKSTVNEVAPKTSNKKSTEGEVAATTPTKISVTPRTPNKKSSAVQLAKNERESRRGALSDSGSVTGGRRKKIPRKYESDMDVASTRKRTTSSNKTGSVDIPDNDPSIRYRFPENTARKTEPPGSYLEKNSTLITSLEKSSHSESTQGYQDSDVSPPTNKKKISVKRTSIGRKSRKKSNPYQADVDSCDSNTSNSGPTQKSVTVQNVSCSSGVYRSESYQLLMPKTSEVVQLEKIDEDTVHSTTKAENEKNEAFKPLSPLTIDVKYVGDAPFADSSQPNTGSTSLGGNLSSISFSLSPELSVVENLSIVQDLISSGRNSDVPNSSNSADSRNKLRMSDVDMSVPLREQDCLGADMEPWSSDSLDQKLKNLLLESSKKGKRQSNRHRNTLLAMDVDLDDLETRKKKAKKRCSTPRKRSSQKPLSNVETLAEHMSLCARGGRTSCPPKINIISCESHTDTEHIGNSNDTIANNKTKEKRKKDVIKVKIQRPKRAQSSGTLSVCTDSGINDVESGVFLQDCCCTDNVDLIHNHSDTCLQTNECIGDSVEFIDNMAKSIISLDDSASVDKLIALQKDEETPEFVTPESQSNNNAHDNLSQPNVATLTRTDTALSGNTVYYTPPENASLDSLMTEDLSQDVPVPSKPSKWYLLGEDSNSTDTVSVVTNSSVGASLHQIFPETCAIPNLSTITEISKDNDTARMISDSDLDTRSNQ